MASAYVEVPLGGKKAAGRVALVDIDDFEAVRTRRWSVYERTDSRGSVSGPYAITNLYEGDRHTTVYMHKLLTGWSRTDHANHDGLDNTRENLRPADSQQNGANRRASRGPKTSQYKGVSWSSRYRKWHAQIRVDGHTRHLGYFAVEEEAAAAYNTSATEAFGKFACLNQL